ncbi:hypothetical protein [Anaerobranca gottschalkii]|uniref:Uncharacterized protein n=1 Tax=Anaerobranca gottschalkii DSM 13577 TaxID=1120990 RepID=A0A1I0B8P4_9FIRM|nr:hypothetical protein [Anaerobranca gottschalkii]SET03157.1 hypothetical protein SAMN03080614_103411 [Anaerobranca gottschalkii DSM 13577]
MSTLVLPNNYVELEQEEMMYLEGGDRFKSAVEGTIVGAGIISLGVGGAKALGGTTIMSMSVTAAAACGPVGWAIIGIVVVSGAVGGYAIGRGISGNW